MNEELEGIVAKMMEEGATDDEISQVIAVYEADYAQPVEEKKNPVVTDSVSEDGFSDLQEPKQYHDTAVNPDGTPMEIADLVPKGESGIDAQTLVTEEENYRNLGAKASTMSGLGRLNYALTNPIEGAVNILTIPQNALAEVLDLPEDHWIRGDADTMKETLGVTNTIGDYYKKEANILKEKKEAIIEEGYENPSVWENIKEGNYQDAFDLTVFGVLESAPISAAIMASGGAFGLTATAVGTTIGLTQPQIDQYKEQFPDKSMAEIQTMGVLSAAAESVFAAIGTGTIGSLYKDIMKKEGAAIGKDIFKNGLIGMYKKALKKYGALAGGIGEGIEEAATQITQNLIEGKKNIFEGVADAFIIGFASGGAMAAPLSTAKVLDKSGLQVAEGQARAMAENLVDEKGIGDIPSGQTTADYRGKSIDDIINTQQKALEGGEVELNIPAVEEPAEGGAVGDTKPPVTPPTTEEVTTGESTTPATQETSPAIPEETTTAKTQEELADSFTKTMNDSRTAVENSQNKGKRTRWNKLRAFVTTRRPEMEQFLKRLGMTESLDAMNAEAGFKAATGLAVMDNTRIVEGLDNKEVVLEGTPDSKGNKRDLTERDVFDNVVKARAILGIEARYESDPERYAHLKDVKHTGGETAASARAFLENLRDTNEEAFEKVMDSSWKYEMRFKDLLDQSLSEGLITPVLHNDLKDFFYSPRKVLDYLTESMNEEDAVYQHDRLANQVKGSLSNFTKKIKGGTKKLDEIDAMHLLNLYTAGQTARIFRNRSHREFANEFTEAGKRFAQMTPKQQAAYNDLSSQIIFDTKDGYSKGNKPKYKIKSTPIGFKPVYYYENGHQNRFFMKEALHEQFTDTMEKPQVAKWVKILTGSTLVKLMATGVNLAFMYANIPMEFVHAMNHSSVYSNFLLKGGSQLGKDYVNGMIASKTQNQLYRDFIENGGGQLFKTMEAKRIWTKKRTLETLSDNVKNRAQRTHLAKALAWTFDLQKATEEGIRIAIFSRRQKQLVDAYLKDNNLPVVKGAPNNGIPKKVMEAINRDAVARSREVADFNRGSVMMKQIEGFIPYANITAQATDAAIQAFKRDPVGTTLRHIQTATASTALFGAIGYALVAMNMDDDEDKSIEDIMIETYNQQSRYTQDKYWIIPTGMKSPNGNWIGMPIRKVESISFLTNFIEEMSLRALAKHSKIGYVERPLLDLLTQSALENFAPIPVKPSLGKTPEDAFLRVLSAVPAVSAAAAIMGVDAYTGGKIDYSGKAIYLEGRQSDRIEPFIKDFADITLGSPARMQKFIQSYITTPNTNPLVGGAYETLNLFSTYKKEKNEGNPVEKVLGAIGEGFKRRMFKEGFEYNTLKKLEIPLSREDINAEKASDDFTAIVKGQYLKFLENPDVPYEKIENDIEFAMQDYLEAVPDMDEDMAMKMLEKTLKQVENKKTYQPVVWQVMFAPSDRLKAKKIYTYFGDNVSEENIEAFLKIDENAKLWEELKDSGALSEDVLKMYDKLLKAKDEDSIKSWFQK